MEVQIGGLVALIDSACKVGWGKLFNLDIWATLDFNSSVHLRLKVGLESNIGLDNLLITIGEDGEVGGAIRGQADDSRLALDNQLGQAGQS